MKKTSIHNSVKNNLIFLFFLIFSSCDVNSAFEKEWEVKLSTLDNSCRFINNQISFDKSFIMRFTDPQNLIFQDHKGITIFNTGQKTEKRFNLTADVKVLPAVLKTIFQTAGGIEYFHTTINHLSAFSATKDNILYFDRDTMISVNHNGKLNWKKKQDRFSAFGNRVSATLTGLELWQGEYLILDTRDGSKKRSFVLPEILKDKMISLLIFDRIIALSEDSGFILNLEGIPVSSFRTDNVISFLKQDDFLIVHAPEQIGKINIYTGIYDWIIHNPYTSYDINAKQLFLIRDNLLEVIDLETGKVIKDISFQEPLTDVKFSDGKLYFLTTKHTLECYGLNL